MGWSWDLRGNEEESLGPSHGLAGSVGWKPGAAVSTTTWVGAAWNEAGTEGSRGERQITVLEDMFCAFDPAVWNIWDFQLCKPKPPRPFFFLTSAS